MGATPRSRMEITRRHRFRMEEKKVPELRFPEFYEAWSSSKLSDLSDVRDGTHDSPNYIENGYPLITSKNLSEDGNIDRINVNYISEKDYNSINKRSKVERGDILFGMIGTIGNPVIVDQDGFAIKNVALIKEEESLINKFFVNYLNTKNILKQFHEQNTGNTQKFIALGLIRSLKVNYPNLIEQQKIASFLSAVDTKIEQLTQKKELLEEYKKGVMQKLFPPAGGHAQPGKQHPELRFKDENGEDFPDWEVTELSEFISDFIVPMRDKPKDLTGSIPWCRIEDFDGKYLSESKSGQGVTPETIDEMNLKILPLDSVIVSCSADLGRCAIVKSELITNQTFIGLNPIKEELDKEFLYYLMINNQRLLNRLSSGTTISYLSRKEFENLKLSFPCLSEQKKISTFLSELDSKLKAIESKIEIAQTFKKGLLQQMFV